MVICAKCKYYKSLPCVGYEKCTFPPKEGWETDHVTGKLIKRYTYCSSKNPYGHCKDYVYKWQWLQDLWARYLT